MSEYKPNILLYGACQLSIVAKWLKKFSCINILQPLPYGIEISFFWERSIFCPRYIGKNKSLLEALNDADYFIFQDAMNPKIFTSKYLYDQSDSKKLCIPRFHLDIPSNFDEQSISSSVKINVAELSRRASLMQSRYESDFIDMSRWIEDNWQDKCLWGSFCRHPSMFYYIELFQRIKNKLFLDLDIDPLKHIPEFSHPPLAENERLQIQKIFPNMEIYKYDNE